MSEHLGESYRRTGGIVSAYGRVGGSGAIVGVWACWAPRNGVGADGTSPGFFETADKPCKERSSVDRWAGDHFQRSISSGDLALAQRRHAGTPARFSWHTHTLMRVPRPADTSKGVPLPAHTPTRPHADTVLPPRPHANTRIRRHEFPSFLGENLTDQADIKFVFL